MSFSFVANHREIWPVSWICGALGVSRLQRAMSISRSTVEMLNMSRVALSVLYLAPLRPMMLSANRLPIARSLKLNRTGGVPVNSAMLSAAWPRNLRQPPPDRYASARNCSLCQHSAARLAGEFSQVVPNPREDTGGTRSRLLLRRRYLRENRGVPPVRDLVVGNILQGKWPSHSMSPKRQIST